MTRWSLFLQTLSLLHHSLGLYSLSGLVTYLELMHAAGLRSSIERHVGLRGGGQGWTDSQVVNSLILAGGESVSDLDVLESRTLGSTGYCAANGDC